MGHSQILMIDGIEKHRAVIKQFLNKTRPNDHIIEIDPNNVALPEDSMDWSEFDLLLIDNQLGSNDGFEWVASQKNAEDFPPVIFLSSAPQASSSLTEQLRQRSQSLGAEDIIFKQKIQPGLLKEKINSALAKRQQQRIDTCGTVAAEDRSQSEIDTIRNPSLAGTLADTFHQIHHAKALLHGHDDWPFPVKDLLAGKAEFSGYRFKEYLGRRDNLYTFSGERLDDGKPFALKLIDRSITNNTDLPDSLKDDLEKLIGVRQANLVNWVDYRYVDGQLLIVQELIQGPHLSDKLRKTGVTREQAINYTLQILSGLQQLHEINLTAGGMTPENLMLKNEHTLVLTHFNNVYFDTSNLDISEKTNYKQSLFLSPEAIQGRHVDHRSDLYVLGTILFRMLEGKPPFSGASMDDVITDHVSAPVPNLSNEDKILNRIIQTLLEKVPSQRFQSADEVIESIHRLQH